MLSAHLFTHTHNTSERPDPAVSASRLGGGRYRDGKWTKRGRVRANGIPASEPLAHIKERSYDHSA